MKYIIILVLVLAGVLFFAKDKILTGYADSSFASVIKSSKKINKKVENNNLERISTSTDMNSVNNKVIFSTTTTGWKCTGPAPECSCLGMSASCRCETVKGVHTCSSGGGMSTTTVETTYMLKTERLVGDKNGVYRGSGSINPTGGKYKAGTVATLTANPSKDSKIIWSAEGCGNDNVCKVKMDQDKTIAYAFVPKGSKLRDVFKTCRIIPFYDPWTKVYRFEMSCAW